MFKILAENGSDLLISYHIVEAEKKEAYAYGLELLFEQATFYIVILIISVLTSSYLFSFLFVAIYKVLRQCTGGFHCKTAGRCFAFSVIIYIFALVLFTTDFNIAEYVLSVSVLSSVFIIIIFAPIENINHPVETWEKKKYRIKSIVISIAITLLTAVSFILNVTIIFYSASCALTADAILIIMSLRRCKDDPNIIGSIGGNG